MPTNKADLVEHIRDLTGLQRIEVKRVTDELLATIAEAIAAGHRVEIRGFGTFCRCRRVARMLRNPQTGAPVPYPARWKPVFIPSKGLRHQVSQGER